MLSTNLGGISNLSVESDTHKGALSEFSLSFSLRLTPRTRTSSSTPAGHCFPVSLFSFIYLKLAQILMTITVGEKNNNIMGLTTKYEKEICTLLVIKNL